MYDLTHQANSSKKVKPYPRPYETVKANNVNTGSVLSLEQARKYLTPKPAHNLSKEEAKEYNRKYLEEQKLLNKK